MKRLSHKEQKGFTLAESVIALGILVVLITGFLAVFGPAADSIRKTLSAEEASRLQDTLTRELTSLRGPREKRDFRDGGSFAKAFDWIARSHVQGGSIILYKYKGDPANIRDDGTMERYRDDEGLSGRDYIIQPMARRVSDPLLEVDLESVEGRLFFVKLTQMIYEDGSWSTIADPEDPAQVAQLSKIIDPYKGGQTDFASNPDRFPEAMITLEARFFTLPTNTAQYLEQFDPQKFNRPVFTRNIGVGR